MRTLPPRGALLLLAGGVAVLILGGFAAAGVSSTLVSPAPKALLAPVFVTALAVGVALVWPAAPYLQWRLVRRLAVIGTLAVAFWSVGTMGRALYATLAFASDGPLEQEWTTWRVLGPLGGAGGARSLTASSAALKRAVAVDFDADAIEEISGGMACVSLALVRNEAGVERIVLPDAPFGVDDLEDCPAVTHLRE